MREIKFRAWDRRANNWLEGVTYTLHTSGRLITTPPHVELMQYTGLKDKHGKDIYEGDILYLEDSEAKRYEVYWNEDRWGLRELVGLQLDYDNGDYYHGDVIDWKEWKVIGNIYEDEPVERN